MFLVYVIRRWNDWDKYVIRYIVLKLLYINVFFDDILIYVFLVVI